MRARDHQQLARCGRCGIELDPHIEHGALDRVSAHAAVAVPREVDQAIGGARDLDDDTVSVQTITRVAELGTAEGGDASEPRVVAQAGDVFRPIVQVIDPVAHVSTLDRRPPRPPIVRSGRVDGVGDFGSEGCGPRRRPGPAGGGRTRPAAGSRRSPPRDRRDRRSESRSSGRPRSSRTVGGASMSYMACPSKATRKGGSHLTSCPKLPRVTVIRSA